MNYLLSDKNSLVWLIFTTYTVATLFIIPRTSESEPQGIKSDLDLSNNRAIAFASRFIMRIVLIFPLLILLKSNV